MSEYMPENISDRMPEDMSEYMPEDMPDRMPDWMPEDMSDRVPDRIDMSEYMPENISDRMPEDMPEDMPDRMPNRMSEDMSDRMPEDLPVRKCINIMVGITRSKVIDFWAWHLNKNQNQIEDLFPICYGHCFPHREGAILWPRMATWPGPERRKARTFKLGAVIDHLLGAGAKHAFQLIQFCGLLPLFRRLTAFNIICLFTLMLNA